MPLSAGDSGFLVACAPDGEKIDTDQSNALLKAYSEGRMKREALTKPMKAAMKSMKGTKKRPAAQMKGPPKKRPARAEAAEDDSDEEYAMEEGEEEEVAGGADEAEEAADEADGGAVHGRDYHLDWYTRDHRVGIKLKHGMKNQLCSFGGAPARDTTPKDELMDIGKKVCEQLKEGRIAETKADARTAADALLQELVDGPRW